MVEYDSFETVQTLFFKVFIYLRVIACEQERAQAGELLI